MLLQRIYDDALAQASYLIGCAATGDAMVVDPNRDIQQYLDIAAAEKLRISHVTETHIHADYASGSRELAERTGARLLLSDEGGDDWRYGFSVPDTVLLHDGDHFTVGNVRIDVMHTPGHTPEHLVFVITDTAASDRPMGMLTGDFIFVGDVGRPDLLERAAHVAGTMEGMARSLFRSLERVRGLPDYLQLWPGHGAGSACGKALGALPSSTLGYERIANWAFQHSDEESFVREVLAGQPEPPRYFARMKRINRDGVAPVPTGELPRLGLDAVERAMREGVYALDPRGSAEFAAGHLPGSINVPLGRSFATWAGTVFEDDAAFVLVGAEDETAAAARRNLMLIGFDDVRGVVGRSILDELRATGRDLSTIGLADPKATAAKTERQIVDVRGTTEWLQGHIPGSRHIFLGDLADEAASIPKVTPITFVCQSGSRSSIAASMLQARGFTDVENLAGGFDAWRSAGQSVERGEPETVPA